MTFDRLPKTMIVSFLGASLVLPEQLLDLAMVVGQHADDVASPEPVSCPSFYFPLAFGALCTLGAYPHRAGETGNENAVLNGEVWYAGCHHRPGGQNGFALCGNG
jgi:hypothetical protein